MYLWHLLRETARFIDQHISRGPFYSFTDYTIIISNCSEQYCNEQSRYYNFSKDAQTNLPIN